MQPVITQHLHDVLIHHPRTEQVHFTEDGHYHLRVFNSDDKKDKNLYTRLHGVPEKSAQGIATGKHINVCIVNNLTGKPDGRYLVVKTMTREEVLSTKPVAAEIVAAAGPSKAEIAATLDVSQEELEAAIKAIAAKRKK